MARSIGHLISKLDHHHGPLRKPTRALAIVAIIALLATGVAPGWALAAQADSEGEGQGTAPPRLGNPEIEPGGRRMVHGALRRRVARESGACGIWSGDRESRG